MYIVGGFSNQKAMLCASARKRSAAYGLDRKSRTLMLLKVSHSRSHQAQAVLSLNTHTTEPRYCSPEYDTRNASQEQALRRVVLQKNEENAEDVNSHDSYQLK